MPDVTLERQIYPNCNLNATKIKESTVSVAKVASNKSFFKYSFCVYKHGFKFQRSNGNSNGNIKAKCDDLSVLSGLSKEQNNNPLWYYHTGRG